MADDPLYFAKNVPGAGTNTRTVFDTDDDRGDEGENLNVTTTGVTKPRISSKKRFELIPGHEKLGTPPSTVVTSTRNSKAGGRNLEAPYCAAAANNQEHPKATHIFYGFRTGEEQAGWPLCPQHLSEANEKLALKKRDNPNILIRPATPITPDTLNKNINIEKNMRDDMSALSSMYVISKGVHPDSPEAAFVAEKAGPGRTPYYNKEDWPSGSPSPTPGSSRTPEEKETALNSVLDRARKGMIRSKNYTVSNPNYDSSADPKEVDALGNHLTAERVPMVTSKNDKEIREIGENQETNRDYSKGNYVRDERGVLTRVFPGNREAQRRRTKKKLAMGTYKKSVNPSTPIGEGDAPIDKVINAARIAKSEGTPLTKDVWQSIIEKHGEGAVKPTHVATTVKALNTPRKKGAVEGKVIPFPGRAGAFAKYKQELSTPEDTAAAAEEHENEMWGLTSRNDSFRTDLDH